jgi:5-methylcytosine-specific restriction endonuclease McrA
MQNKTLLLTPWYFPHKILRWQDAVTMIFLGKADVVVEYDTVIRSPSTEMNAPAVIRVKKPMRSMKHGAKFSRINVYTRDDFTCQYCGERFAPRMLSYDHVVPRSAGGRTEWTNIVTACKPCNNKKGHRTCDESGMWPRSKPKQPKTLPLTGPMVDLEKAPPEWRDFLPAVPA